VPASVIPSSSAAETNLAGFAAAAAEEAAAEAAEAEAEAAPSGFAGFAVAAARRAAALAIAALFLRGGGRDGKDSSDGEAIASRLGATSSA
jgi:hypothetical protein